MAHSKDQLAELESRLKASGHDRWGLVDYRGTYNSDKEWTEFMTTLENETRRILESYGATETIKAQHVWTVIEERERLENATKSDVRRMFNEWVHSLEAAAEQPNTKGTPPMLWVPRYLFCFHVDEASLRSVLEGSDNWHVNIVNRRWIPEDDESDEEDPQDDEQLTEEELEDMRKAVMRPEIEGCTEVRFTVPFANNDRCLP
jgi:hypothetical protein